MENKKNLLENKNNLLENSLSYDKEVGSVEDFSKRFDELKNKVVELRDVNQDYFALQKQARELAKVFISDFGATHKAELGKSVSWLGDVFEPDELLSIIGDSINQLDRARLYAKVKDRLAHGYDKPEFYMDDRINTLVNQLNVYDSYVDTFNSIDIGEGDNCLDKNKYLISHDLHNLLENGYKVTGDRTITKNSDGLYLVVFGNTTVKGENVLVYNYIKYSGVFYDVLYSYIKNESSSTVITNDKSVGVDYLFVMRYFFENKDQLVNEIKSISNLFNHKTLYSTSRGIYPRNIVDLCKVLLQGCPVFLDNNDICKFVRLAWERKSYDAVEGLVNLYDFYKDQAEGLTMLQEKLKKTNLDNFNFLGRLVFITDDLHGLIKDLRSSVNKGVNEGPQPWRGQSNSLSHTISRIDSNFRESLNRHNQYHVNVGNIPKGSLIGRNKFLYQNIHKNLGNVRFYSTKVYVQPVTKDNSDIYHEIGDYIKNSPVNRDTQLKIENSLYNHSYLHLIEKNKGDKPLIDYSIMNKKLSKFLLEERLKLVDYINRDKSLVFEKEPVKVNDKILFLLNKVLNGLDNDYVITVIYGRFFKIVSQYQVSAEYNKAVNLFVDIGGDLVENFYYNLYKKRQNELKSVDYRLSDWKSENSGIVSMFTNTSKAEIGGKIIGWLKNMDLVRFELITKSKTDRENLIVPTDRVVGLLGGETSIKPLPRRLPMIIKPNVFKRIISEEGVKEILGVYLLNNEKYVNPLIIPKWNFGKPTLIKDDNLVYDLVNNINSVGYKVNNDVMGFIATYGSRYDLLINSAYIHPLSNKPKLTKSEYIELTSFLSQKDLQDSILSIAELYSTKHEFFIPTSLDFRGRLYCVSEYLNYQSTELAKALLIFSRGEKLYKSDKESINYLKAYGANCYGNKLDKMSWKNRCEWVDDNTDKILDFKNGELIKKAEKKKK